jgi:hypothetical protein
MTIVEADEPPPPASEAPALPLPPAGVGASGVGVAGAGAGAGFGVAQQPQSQESVQEPVPVQKPVQPKLSQLLPLVQLQASRRITPGLTMRSKASYCPVSASHVGSTRSSKTNSRAAKRMGLPRCKRRSIRLAERRCEPQQLAGAPTCSSRLRLLASSPQPLSSTGLPSWIGAPVMLGLRRHTDTLSNTECNRYTTSTWVLSWVAV